MKECNKPADKLHGCYLELGHKGRHKCSPFCALKNSPKAGFMWVGMGKQKRKVKLPKAKGKRRRKLSKARKTQEDGCEGVKKLRVRAWRARFVVDVDVLAHTSEEAREKAFSASLNDNAYCELEWITKMDY